MTTFELPAVERHLVDRHGTDHLYEITPLPFDESLNLGLELADLVGGPIGEGLKSMMMGGDVDLNAISTGEIGIALREITSLPRRLLTMGGATVIARIFKGTMRATLVNDKLEKRYLENPDARTEAFSGGNQREAAEAVKEVIMVNYGPFLMGLYEIASPYLGGFGDGLKSIGQPSPSAETSESPETSGSDTSKPSKPIEAP